MNSYRTKSILTLVFTGLVLLGTTFLSANVNYDHNDGGKAINDTLVHLDKALTWDKSVKKGVLKNGMTYYLHHTKVTKGVASYYIIQNVGSILENDDQQGLAHFLEHMAFNGTKNFPGKGILETVQKEGLVFGRDINAYTNFNETVYNVSNLPTRPGLIDTGLRILHDWSNHLLLTDEEIDAERGVIKEEWRTTQNAGNRILEQTIGSIANHSKYGERLPIGKMEIVDNFKYETLRKFYRDWYRTDLQAIAIIGDIDVEMMEGKIKKLFSSIPAIQDAPERYEVKIDDNDGLVYDMAMDREVSTSRISYTVRHYRSNGTRTIADLKYNLMNNMVVSMLSKRFEELQQPGSPYTYAGVRFGRHSLARSYKSLGLDIYPTKNQQNEAFEQVLSEFYRAVKFGFTQSEIARVKAEFINSYSNYVATLNNRSHRSIVNNMKNDFLEGHVISDPKVDIEIVKKIFGNLTEHDFLQHVQEMYAPHNRTLIVTAVEGDKNLSKNEALAIIEKVENDDTLQPYEEDNVVKPLLSDLEITKGTIASEYENTDTGATEFILGNGIKVYYKFVDKTNNDVRLEAISYGGNSLLNVEDWPSSSMVSHLIGESGLGDFNIVDLKR